MQNETLVAMARRHVQEGEAHINKQRVIIGRLGNAGLPTKEALRLLAQFELSQAEYQRHLDRIVEQQRTGERDSNGALIIAPGLKLN